jgi:lysozyme
VLDLEWDSREDKSKRMGAQTIIAWAMEWLRWVEAETDVVPMIYTGPNFIQRLGNPKALHRYPLWMARYTRRREPTRQIPGWPWTIWQYTGRGRTNGVRGNVDLNRFAGSMDDLARWTR